MAINYLNFRDDVMKDILLLCLIFLCLLLTFFPLLKKAYYNYQRKKEYTQILNEVVTLFETVNPFQISKDARKEIADPPPDLVYGEIGICTLLDLLTIIQPKPDALYYDLGSGAGKSALAVKLRYPSMRVKGIELLAALHAVSEQKLLQYLQQHKLPQESFGLNFICDNILNQDFTDADIIFINATAISHTTWEQILYKLIQLKPGAKIITTSKRLPAPTFVKKYQGMELMSWGLTSTYIYEKII